MIISRKIEGVALTAEQWELFTSMRGADAVATKLNEAFMQAVNEGKSCAQVRQAVEKVMDDHLDFGAGDTEPANHLEDLLEKVFPESYD